MGLAFFNFALYIKIVMRGIFFRISKISKIQNFDPQKFLNTIFLYFVKIGPEMMKMKFFENLKF